MQQYGHGEPAGAAGHFIFRILVRLIAPIAHAAAQADDAHAVMDIELILDADAALRRLLLIVHIVIAVNIEDGRVRKAGQEGQIGSGQIAAGDDQIDALQAALVKAFPEPGIGFVGQDQYFHVVSSFSGRVQENVEGSGRRPSLMP